jgi:hypothetical protein
MDHESQEAEKYDEDHRLLADRTSEDLSELSFDEQSSGFEEGTVTRPRQWNVWFLPLLLFVSAAVLAAILDLILRATLGGGSVV